MISGRIYTSDLTGLGWAEVHVLYGRKKRPRRALGIAGLCRLRKQTPESRVVLKDQLSSQVILPSLCITADTFALLIVILVLLTSY
jgi:hypothetical protein